MSKNARRYIIEFAVLFVFVIAVVGSLVKASANLPSSVQEKTAIGTDKQSLSVNESLIKSNKLLAEIIQSTAEPNKSAADTIKYLIDFNQFLVRSSSSAAQTNASNEDSGTTNSDYWIYGKIANFLSSSPEIRFVFLCELLLASLAVLLFLHWIEATRLESEHEEYKRVLDENLRNIGSSQKRYYNFEHIYRTIRSLNRAILRYSTIGKAALLVTVFTMIIVGSFVFHVFNHVLDEAQKFQNFDNGKTVLLIIIIILRTSLLGSFIIAFTIYSFKFSSSSFDQSVRFTKRKHATLFLLQMLNSLRVP